MLASSIGFFVGWALSPSNNEEPAKKEPKAKKYVPNGVDVFECNGKIVLRCADGLYRSPEGYWVPGSNSINMNLPK